MTPIWLAPLHDTGTRPFLAFSPASAYSGYAGHLAALALFAAHGLRPGGGQGHHEMAFAGAAALGDEALVDLVPDSIEVRELRKGSMYDPKIAGAPDCDRAIEWMRRTLPTVREVLVAADPDFGQLLRESR